MIGKIAKFILGVISAVIWYVIVYTYELELFLVSVKFEWIWWILLLIIPVGFTVLGIVLRRKQILKSFFSGFITMHLIWIVYAFCSIVLGLFMGIRDLGELINGVVYFWILILLALRGW